MIRTLIVCLAALALSMDSAASSYAIDIPHPLQVGAIQLKAGQYEVQIKGKLAVFWSGKSSIPVPVEVEKDAGASRYTVLETINNRLLVIHPGGSEKKLVFPADGTATNVGE